MDRRLSIDVNWQGNLDREATFERVRIADEAGVDSVFVGEAWGEDAFSILVQLADRTRRIRLGSGVVNYYSRTPAALAQHFGTLDNISEGRALIGLGASSATVVEQFHGVPFNPALARMRETVQIINTLIREEPLYHTGKWFNLQRGFTLRFKTYRPHIPVYIASFRPRAMRVVADVADGWMPRMIPIQKTKQQVDRLLGLVKEAGRDPSEMTVRAAGTVTVARDVESARRAGKGTVAFYVARMGDYYYDELCDMGYREECDAIRRAWAEHGSRTAAESVSDGLADALATYGSVEQCRDRLIEQEEAGVTLHTVQLWDAESPAAAGRIYEALMK
ncbi:MAG TPA: LLM class flavin-dependent oxidoreductase [Dehalococcoidia bacterium]|nr:LLM class flavin-dependent oxidoreductase [Dehalococcoidia bacterium]